MDFVVPADPRVKLKESEKRNKYLDLARERKKKHEGDGDTNCNWYARYSHKRFGTGTGGLGKKRISGETFQTIAL